MPAPIEMAVMSSLWTLAKGRATGRRADVATVTLDFKIGYVGTSVLAFAFLLLGTALMFGASTEFSRAGPVFSTQLVDLYANTLGAWTRPVVLVAVITTIFSTTLIVIDGFPRVMDRCIQNFGGRPEPEPTSPPGKSYWPMMIVFGVLNVLGLSLFNDSLTPMIDFATIFTFATAPILGYLNLRSITAADVPAEHRPGRYSVAVSYAGLLLLGGTTLVYVASRVMAQ